MKNKVLTSLVLAAAAAVIVVVIVVIVGNGDSDDNNNGSTSQPATGDVQVSAQTVSGLGPILVNDQGFTLYTFVPDQGERVTCVGSCATVWPPVFVEDEQKPAAVGAVKQALLGMDESPEGGQVVTYNGWPLYTYVADTEPGQAVGQALDLNGGLWYVISPDGEIIKQKP